MTSRYHAQALPPTHPVSFEAGSHVLRIWRGQNGRWALNVDGGAELPTTFMTQAEAWECGVREAESRPPVLQR
ncbi:MAG TPA: hypothetical protein VF400_14320 [Anaeromyxobacteraceae bacterium]